MSDTSAAAATPVSLKLQVFTKVGRKVESEIAEVLNRCTQSIALFCRVDCGEVRVETGVETTPVVPFYFAIALLGVIVPCTYNDFVVGRVVACTKGVADLLGYHDVPEGVYTRYSWGAVSRVALVRAWCHNLHLD